MTGNHLLLLGAGFSKNWNAPLASEVASSLVQQFGNEPDLRNLLTQHGKNFENALYTVQRDYLSSPSPVTKDRLDKLQTAIVKMFDDLNAILENKTYIEFSNDMQFSVRQYLTRFQAIFNLNQDLLLEVSIRAFGDACAARTLERCRASGIEADGRFNDRGYRGQS